MILTAPDGSQDYYPKTIPQLRRERRRDSGMTTDGASSGRSSRTRVIRVLPLLAGLWACGGSDVIGPEPSRAAGLEGRWVMVSLQEAGGAEVAAPQTPELTAEFRSAIFGIEYGCGSCGGTHTVGDGSIDIIAVTCTDVAVCPASTETYLLLVQQSSSWSATPATLELSSDSGRVRFRR